MIELTNYVSKILFQDKMDSYYVITYIDIDQLLDNTLIIEYMGKILLKNNILKQDIIQISNKFYIYDLDNFDLSKYYTIQEANKESFDNYISEFTNKNNKTNWNFLFLVDKKMKKTRIYFKIHHGYADGYKIIQILMSGLTEETDFTKKFVRKTSIINTIYHIIISTIMLIMVYTKFFIKVIHHYLQFNPPDDNNVKKTDYIICKEIYFNEIKTFTIKRGLTINDFLYAIMIKTDYLYTDKERNISTVSPINISGNIHTNNMCPIFNVINNNYSNSQLLIEVHRLFNMFKYSLFIPFFSKLINYTTPFISIDILSQIYSMVIDNADYTFSNIIGPDVSNLKYKIENIHFLTKTKYNEIVFNIISCKDKVNIICSFKKGVIKNKKRFKKCVENACNSLLSS